MDVKFTHPRKLQNMFAEVSPELKSNQAIQALLSPENGPFLNPVPVGSEYLLVLERTNTIIASNITLGDAGVLDGDTLAVVLTSYAA